MSEITLTIDGKEVKGKAGDTILDVCRANGIDVPTLCYLEELSVVGACRLCIVEVEGSRRLNSACTTPAADGMVVRTETEKLNSYRRIVLELLFSERNHFCPACVMNGDCDLQAMAYRLGMEHVRYSYLFPKYEMDNSHPYIGMDPNRCILCTRCIRACDEITGVHTLDLKERGWQAQIEVDLRGELGNSSCVSCGACVQVCPTGALFEKLNAYRSKRAERRIAKAICTVCSVGCGFEVSIKDEQVVGIDGDFASPVNKGLLCPKGRFEPLERIFTRQRTPLVRSREVTWAEALQTIADVLTEVRKNHGAQAIAGVASPSLTNENLRAFRKFLTEVVETPNVDTFYSRDLKIARASAQQVFGEAPPSEATLDDLRQADCVLLIGCTPEESHEVLASSIRRGAMNRRTRLLIVNTRSSELDRLADVRLRPIRGTDNILLEGLMGVILKAGWAETTGEMPQITPEEVERQTAIRPEELEKLARIYASASHPVILYGRGLTRTGGVDAAANLMRLAQLTGNVRNGKMGVLGLRKGGNAQGAADLKIYSDFSVEETDPTAIRVLYIMAGDTSLELSEALLDKLREVEVVLFQGSHPGSLAGIADVILPAALWFEQAGSMTNMEGKTQSFDRLIERNPVLGEYRDDRDVLAAIAELMADS